jgi:hypothetical protein
MNKIWAVAFIGLSVACHAQRQTTIRVSLLPSEEIAVVSFDANKTSEAEIKRWMQLADGAYYDSPEAHGVYSCKPTESSGYAAKLEKEVADSQKVVNDLDPNAYPPELSHVVIYLKRLQSFWLWQAEQELAYIRSRETPGLEWKDLDAREKCSKTTEKLANATDRYDGCRVVFFDWHNCTNKAFLDQLGQYPKSDWDAFLTAHDLHVKIISTADN